MKMLSKAVGNADCRPDNNRIKVATLASQVASGDTKMVPKTIYNFKQKTKEQIQDILLNEEQQFLKDNPDYQYDNYRYEEGKHGERTIMLILIKK